MNFLKICYILFLLMSSVFVAKSQKMGAYASFNTNIIRLSSEYGIPAFGRTPLPSYSFGCFIKTREDKQIKLTSMLDYSKLRNNFGPVPIVDEMGNMIGETERKMTNDIISLSGIGVLKRNIFYYGLGVSGNFLLNSKLKQDEFKAENSQYGQSYLEDNEAKTFSVEFYKTFTFSIPIIIGFEIKNIDAFLKLNLGCSDKLKGNNFIKEFDNTLQVGIGYTIFEKN